MKKGILTEFLYQRCKLKIWIVNIVETDIFPVKYEFRGIKGYRGIQFTAKLSEIISL